MKKSTLALTALALNLGRALSLVSVFVAETASTNQQLPSLAPMLEKVMPSVVSISVESSTPVTSRQMPDQSKQFFGQNSLLCQGGSDERSDDGGEGCSAPAQEKFQALGAGSLSMPRKAMW